MGLINNLIQFISGTKAISSEVNQNFETLRSGHNDQENRLNSVENTYIKKDGSVAFTGSPIVPSGTLTGHAINKNQLDSHISNVIHNKFSIRQTILTGPVDASGNANFITAWGSGYGVDIGSVGAGILASFSEGFNNRGIVEHIGYINSTIQVGSLITGQSITSLTRSGTTATAVTANPHGLKIGSIVTIAGAVQADYNGTFTVISTPANNTFTYTVANTAVTPATGTITCSMTLFLYFDIDDNANVTANYSVLPPVYAYTKSANLVDDQHSFVIPEMKMYRYTGSGWEVKRRVFIGEVITNTTGVAGVITYAYRGKYHSDWFSVTASTLYIKNHNIGVSPEHLSMRVYGRKNSNFGTICIGFYPNEGSGSGRYGANYGVSTRNTSKLFVASTYFLVATAGYGAGDVGATDVNTASGEALIVIERSW